MYFKSMYLVGDAKERLKSLKLSPCKGNGGGIRKRERGKIKLIYFCFEKGQAVKVWDTDRG